MGKVFTRGFDAFADPLTPEQMKAFMGPALAKSAVLSLVFGVLFAWFFARFRGSLWVEGGGPLAGMEFGTVLWLPTILLSTLGGSVWWTPLAAVASRHSDLVVDSDECRGRSRRPDHEVTAVV